MAPALKKQRKSMFGPVQVDMGPGSDGLCTWSMSNVYMHACTHARMHVYAPARAHLAACTSGYGSKLCREKKGVLHWCQRSPGHLRGNRVDAGTHRH